MLALFVLRRYAKLHVLIIRCQYSKYHHLDPGQSHIDEVLMPAHAHAAPDATTRTLTRSYPGRPSQVRAVRADLRALMRDCPHAD